jgi:hypothetical protein
MYLFTLFQVPLAILKKRAIKIPDIVAHLNMLATAFAPSNDCFVICPTTLKTTLDQYHDVS